MNGSFKEGETLYGELQQQIRDRTAERDTLASAMRDACSLIQAGRGEDARLVLQAVLNSLYALPVMRALYQGRLS